VYDIVAKNIAQAIPSVSEIINSTITPVVIIAPAIGRKAIVNGVVWCVNTGAGAEGRLVANGVIIGRWPTGGLENTDAMPDAQGAAGMRLLVRLRLRDLQIDGGQTLELQQDAGANAQFKRQLQINELNG